MTEAPAVLPAADPFGPGQTTAGKSAAGPSTTGPSAAAQSATGPTGGRDRAACSPTGGPAAQESCGAVTAEFAITLPAVLLLLAMLLAGASAGVTQLRLEEGARAGARALARGDDSATVERIVRTLAGGSASAAVSADGEWLHVTVTDRVGGPLGASIPWHLTARASTRSETAG
ncbi:TadE family type IV pilus minor pilin [Pseudarthrobacter oxydans]|uniref:TadE family type IV pilus minor pilin n=1 Tax=Pseudarthrobacter oxydans TaxID=1671 RepID=UPI0038150CDB